MGICVAAELQPQGPDQCPRIASLPAHVLFPKYLGLICEAFLRNLLHHVSKWYSWGTRMLYFKNNSDRALSDSQDVCCPKLGHRGRVIGAQRKAAVTRLAAGRSRPRLHSLFLGDQRPKASFCAWVIRGPSLGLALRQGLEKVQKACEPAFRAACQRVREAGPEQHPSALCCDIVGACGHRRGRLIS